MVSTVRERDLSRNLGEEEGTDAGLVELLCAGGDGRRRTRRRGGLALG